MVNHSSYYLKISIALISTFLLFSCDSNPTEKSEMKQTPDLPKATCYESNHNGDVVYLKLTDSSQVLKGRLEYLPYEKDGTVGDLVDLTFTGDTLFGMYYSSQEGIDDSSEMALLKIAKGYILTTQIDGGENYQYDSTSTHGKFIDRHKITFTGDTLLETTCK